MGSELPLVGDGLLSPGTSAESRTPASMGLQFGLNPLSFSVSHAGNDLLGFSEEETYQPPYL